MTGTAGIGTPAPSSRWASLTAGARQPGRPRPLLPAPARLAALPLITACVAVIAVGGTRYQHQDRPGRLDRAVDDWLLAHGGAHQLAVLLVAQLGVAIPVAVMAGALIAACARRRRWRGAALVAVAVPVASALTELLLKPLFGRTIRGFLSFPSGRATCAFAIAAAIAVLLASPAAPRLPGRARLGLAVAGFAVASAVAAAAVVMRFHYFTDTIGGAAVGTGTVLATALVLDWLSPRLTRLKADRSRPPDLDTTRTPDHGQPEQAQPEQV